MFRFDASVLDPPPKQDRHQLPIRLPVPVGETFRFHARQTVASRPAGPAWEPLAHQQPPAGDAWDTWLLVGGRGAGKTRAGAEWVLDHLRTAGKAARVGIGAPDLASARDVCAEGESGLISIAPDEFPRYHRSVGYCEAWHEAGGYVRFMGSENPKRWNGPQWSRLWWDEWALCHMDSYRESQFGLRLGADPRQLITTTPKAVAMQELSDLAKRVGVVVTRASTYDNPYLPDRRKAELERDFGDTTLGRSELLGELVIDTEGALWKHAWIQAARVREAPPLSRVVVAIDPAGGNGNQSAQTGLCVAGMDAAGDYYVLAMDGVQLPPHQWLDRAVALYQEHRADALVAEMNYGGPFIREMAAKLPDAVNFQMVYATRGKAVRAEPIAALYARGRVHHVGLFPEGEAQLCAFPLTRRKDMTDALVWAVSYLTNGAAAGSFGDLEAYATVPATPQFARFG